MTPIFIIGMPRSGTTLVEQILSSHEDVFGKAFEDPKRRTPGIDKIIEFTGMKPTKNIEFMVENIVDSKKNK